MVLHGSVASRLRPLDGVAEIDTFDVLEIKDDPGKMLPVDGGKGEPLPTTARCSMLRPTQKGLEGLKLQLLKRVGSKLLAPCVLVHTLINENQQAIKG